MKSKSMIVGALVVLVVALLWYEFLYSPIKSKTSKANAAAQTAQSQVDTLQRQIDQLTAEAKKAAAKDIGTAQYLEAVPVNAAEAAFMRNLDAIRIGSGAEVQSITPSPPTSAGTVTSINVSIQVQGTEDQLARYLNGLYSLHRVFIPDNVTLTAPGAKPTDVPYIPPGALFAGGKMTMQIAGRIFAGPAVVAPTTGTSTSSGSAASTATTKTSTPASSSTSG